MSAYFAPEVNMGKIKIIGHQRLQTKELSKISGCFYKQTSM